MAHAIWHGSGHIPQLDLFLRCKSRTSRNELLLCGGLLANSRKYRKTFYPIPFGPIIALNRPRPTRSWTEAFHPAADVPCGPARSHYAP